MFQFDGKVAKKYGVRAAVILANLGFWMAKNQVNNKHLHEGRYWTYNSVRAFRKIFYFLTEKQIRYCLEKLVSDGVLLRGNFNLKGYDRTLWYTIIDEWVYERCCPLDSEVICQNGQMDSPTGANGFAQNGKPIPDIKPDIKPDKKKEVMKCVRLTPDEYDKLAVMYGTDGREQLLLRLSAAKQAKGYKYKSDYGAILSWVVKDLGYERVKPPTPAQMKKWRAHGPSEEPDIERTPEDEAEVRKIMKNWRPGRKAG